MRIFLFFHLNCNYVIRIGTRQDRDVSVREFSNHLVLSMSDSTTAVSLKYTQDLSVQIVFFTFSCKWFLCFYFWAVIWSYIVNLFAALHELASASARTLLKLASSMRALLKPYGDTLRWPNTVLARALARAQGFQKTNMPSTERSFYLINTHTICVIFLYNCMQCIDGSSILLQRYVTKGNDTKNQHF